MEQADMMQSQGPQVQACAAEERWSSGRRIIPALGTPLASIFGSGFLVIVPVLASGVGPYAVWAMLAVAFVAFHTGAIVRHNILCAEPVLAASNQRATLVLERLSDAALVLAYVVSVCLYIHILSAFVLGAVGLDSGFNKSLLTTVVIGLITVIGILGGLKPLERLERWALYVTFLMLALLLIGFAVYDAQLYLDTGRFALPALPQRSGWEMLTIVAGTLIVVQGFETPRYLGRRFDTGTRIRASRWSQYVSLSIYVAFVALALPIVPVLNGHYADNSLIQLAAAVSVLLAMPLVLAAGLSQFSAAVADTLAAAGNLEEVTRRRLSQRWGYLLVAVSAMLLAWTGSTFTVIALASRAFALYYLLQCLVALSVCRNRRERLRFLLVALALGFVLLFAVPAG
ncbi:hypothetical protein Tel_03585 [Candidatus Tenderia electrophaga]|jgi:hypothetical protein|uniref:Amino acid permease n=1 Tax=Candidatus Tenderia electrophaga TaxID=1748243 RepID=A0A0S2TAW7_9GAMM|nr:hypothetical protein Tel_03585 [Candidatus Tenderia electrophaga]